MGKEEERKEGGEEPSKWEWLGVWANALNSVVVWAGTFMWATAIYSSASLMAGYVGPGGAAQLLEAAGVEHIQSGSIEPTPRVAPVAPAEEEPEGEYAV